MKESVWNKEDLMRWFEGCGDVTIHEIDFELETDPLPVYLAYVQDLCDMNMLDNEVIPSLERALKDTTFRNVRRRLTHTRHRSRFELQTDADEVMLNVFSGQLFVLIERVAAYTVDISLPPQRTPEEPNTEISIRGPRDGFTEMIGTNAALIRRRIRSNSLRFQTFQIGKKSPTTIGLFYMDGMIEPRVLEQIRSELRALESSDVDGIFNTNQLEELLTDKKFSLFPMFHYTGRPDFAARSLKHGRFVLLLDGAPTVTIAPTNLTLLMKTAEDHEIIYLYSSLERLLRIVGISIAVFLPGLWVSFVGFHQDQIPFTLLASLAQVRLGVPLPIALEAFIMLIIFEMFREAGLRLPGKVGQTLSVVGGLIIGDAAIRAGLTNPAMVVIIASSAVATFSLVNQSLAGTVTLLRIGVLLVSSLLGLFGFLVSAFVILAYVCNLRSYGLPYMAPLSTYRFHDMARALLRPSSQETSRPTPLVETERKRDDRQ